MIADEIQKFRTEQSILQDSLESLPNSAAFTRQKAIITGMDTATDRIINNFDSFERQQDIVTTTTNNNDTLLNSRQDTLSIVDQQLNIASETMSRIKNDDINNHRLLEINNFYNGYYLLYLTIFRYIIYTCTFLLVVALLKTLGFITISISNLLVMIIISIGGYFIINAALDISYRNNVDINEYEFPIKSNIDDVPAYESVQENDISILQELEDKFNCLRSTS